MQPPRIEKVLTEEEQHALTPDEVLQSFKEDNQRFVEDHITSRDHSALVRDAAAGQHPKAVVISCLDSRVTVEDIFDNGIGDIFIGRVAGNFVNEDMLGSIEFGCKVAGAKLVVVMGHKHCGAIRAAIENVQLGNITAMLSKLKPAITMSENFEGKKISTNEKYASYVAKNNVQHNIDIIRQQSPILKEMEDAKRIKIVGAFYDINTGIVHFFE